MLAGVLGFGYMYVGQLRRDVILLTLSVLTVAVVAWTRIIFQPWGFVLLCSLLLGLFLLRILHPAWIARRQPNAPARAYNRWWAYLLWIALVGASVDVLIGHREQWLGYGAFRIPSGSMTPSVAVGDFIFVDSWRYHRQRPELGEIVVYTDASMNGASFVKRIVGLPGDEIEIRQNVVFRNGQPLPEPYLDQALNRGPRGVDWPAVRLADDAYYLLGDSRDFSRDSRQIGPVRGATFLGRVELRWFSMERWTIHWERFPLRIHQTP